MGYLKRIFNVLFVLAIMGLAVICFPDEAAAVNGRNARQQQRAFNRELGRQQAQRASAAGFGVRGVGHHHGLGASNFGVWSSRGGRFVILADGTVIFVQNHH